MSGCCCWVGIMVNVQLRKHDLFMFSAHVLQNSITNSPKWNNYVNYTNYTKTSLLGSQDRSHTAKVNVIFPELRIIYVLAFLCADFSFTPPSPSFTMAAVFKRLKKTL